MDARVLEVQQWLGNTFPSYFYYDETGINSGSFPVEPDGMTGNTTVTALIMALQITLNLSPIDGIWGNGTTNACPTISSSASNGNLLKIVQSGLICKGYNPGTLDGYWGNNTANAISQFKSDLGFSNPSSQLSPAFFKFLLTTDPSIIISGSNVYIRAVQQYLNANYSSLFVSTLGYIPTGGFFERKTSKALIYAFQYCIGTTADGVLGPNTFSLMPTISAQSTNDINVVKILQCALICNQFMTTYITGEYDGTTTYAVAEFQSFMCLSDDNLVNVGDVNRRTWGALLWSRGDTSRDYNAIDTITRLSTQQCSALYQNGVRYIGRYLTKVQNGLDKNMTDDEIVRIHNSGCNIIPIFQESNSSANDFNYSSGYESWNKAIKAATKLRIPQCTIYFAVDFDVTDYQVKTIIKEYFQGINDAKSVNPSIYDIGIYSTRNACQKINEYGLAIGCYISDMSSAYSGNLGYTMPDNWNFDQFYEGNIAIGSDTLHFDKVIASGDDEGFSSFASIGNDNWNLHTLNYTDINLSITSASSISTIISTIYDLENAYEELYPNGTAIECLYSVLYYLWHYKYTTLDFNITLQTNEDFSYGIESSIDYQQLVNSLSNFINNNSLTILKDSQDKLFELPHLAIVIAAYLEIDLPVVKKEWYGWAGDLASSFLEIKVLKNNLGNQYIDDITHARDRIGRMEVSPDVVQFNYCDYYADIDAFNIYTLIMEYVNQDLYGNHILSEAMLNYYNNDSMLSSRIYRLMNNLPITQYNVSSITQELKEYFLDSNQFFLRSTKSNMANPTQDDINIIEACCQSFAEIIIHDFSQAN